MNWATTLHDIADRGDSHIRYARPQLVCDDVYMPSELAARLFPPDGYHDGERIVWDLTALGGDRLSRGH